MQTHPQSGGYRFLFMLAVAVNFFATPARAANATIYTKIFKPFIFLDDNGEISGISRRIGDDFCNSVGITCDWYMLETTPDIINRVASTNSSEIDRVMGLAGITITAEREKVLDFSTPFYTTSLAILVSQSTRTSAVVAIFDALTTNEVTSILCLMVLAASFFGNLFWAVERRKNEQFQKGYLKGVITGTWWAMVTVTTGYGDVVPKTQIGRMVAVFWMVLSVLVLSLFAGAIASAFTVSSMDSSISSLGELNGKRVAVIDGTTSEITAQGAGCIPVLGNSFEDIIAHVEGGRAVAALYDAPALYYYLSTNNAASTRYKVVALDAPEPYGMAFPEGSRWVEQANRFILAGGAQPHIDAYISRFSSSGSTESVSEPTLIYITIAILGVYVLAITVSKLLTWYYLREFRKAPVHRAQGSSKTLSEDGSPRDGEGSPQRRVSRLIASVIKIPDAKGGLDAAEEGAAGGDMDDLRREVSELKVLVSRMVRELKDKKGDKGHRRHRRGKECRMDEEEEDHKEEEDRKAEGVTD